MLSGAFLIVSWCLAGFASANPFRIGLFTPLKNDEHPCVAENLKESHRYLCDDEANVICLSGWREPTEDSLRDPRNPCPIPICEYDGETCSHGECVRPDVCACHVGWEGHLCNKCIALPGCDHGSCSNAFECNCESNEEGVAIWEGAFCDRPACPSCNPEHGTCFEPLICTCLEGWTGTDCNTCVKLPGCVNGDCDKDKPNTCKCRPGWTGHLCDQPVCREGCHLEHGYCEEPDTCLCSAGWQGDLCDECVTYWQCPSQGKCVDPNQCICDEAAIEQDSYKVCNRENINGPHYGNFGSCSNPCKENPEAGAAPGKRVRECRWTPNGDCLDIEENCYGEKNWIVQESGPDDFANCIYTRNGVDARPATSSKPEKTTETETKPATTVTEAETEPEPETEPETEPASTASEEPAPISESTQSESTTAA